LNSEEAQPAGRAVTADGVVADDGAAEVAALRPIEIVEHEPGERRLSLLNDPIPQNRGPGGVSDDEGDVGIVAKDVCLHSSTLGIEESETVCPQVVIRGLLGVLAVVEEGAFDDDRISPYPLEGASTDGADRSAPEELAALTSQEGGIHSRPSVALLASRGRGGQATRRVVDSFTAVAVEDDMVDANVARVLRHEESAGRSQSPVGEETGAVGSGVAQITGRVETTPALIG